MKTITCKKYIRQAVQQLSGNEHLPGYLIGLADAWKLVGAIDRETWERIRAGARAIHESRKGRSA